MKSLGNILNQTIYEVAHEGDSDYLRFHPGDAFDVLSSATGRLSLHSSLAQSAPGHAEALVREQYGLVEKLCESPIERDMLAALMSGNWHFCANPFVPVHNARNNGEAFPDAPVVIVPQFAIARFRLDFALVAKTAAGVRIVAIECDGADYHDTLKDAARDSYLRSYGVITARLTGSAIHADAIHLADRMITEISSWFDHE